MTTLATDGWVLTAGSWVVVSGKGGLEGVSKSWESALRDLGPGSIHLLSVLFGGEHDPRAGEG